MKKQFLFAVAATMLTACVNTDTLRDYNVPQGSENDGSILFTSFTDKVTKATAENSDALYTWTFYEHQTSFKVWGRKAGQAGHEIFNGTTVTVAPATDPADGYTYTYSPARFWDKNAANYNFYAAAPADDSWDFKDDNINENSLDAGYFETSATLNGVNLKHVNNNGPGATLSNVFKNISVSSTNDATDIDKLIAAPCEVPNTYYNKAVPNAVNLNFIHILSKLNVTISTSLYDANHAYDVDLLAFEIYNIPNAGNFDESTAIPNDKKIIRWTRDGETTTNILTGIDNSINKVHVANPTAENAAANSTGAKTYIVESLIMPQKIEYARVALDGKSHNVATNAAVYFSDWEDYTQSMPIEALTKAQFDELYVITEDESTEPHTFTYTGVRTLSQYQALEGKAGTTEPQFKELLAKVEKTPAINIPAYAAVSETSSPYFRITYSIDGDVFTQYFNLAAAFKNYTNNEKVDGEGALTDDQKKFGFYEGWQNTLNIIINPTAITFTADVATWSTEQNYNYEIEKGNQ